MIYDQDCFIENPYYVQDRLTEDDCNTCKDLQSIQRISEADQSDIAENNLYTNTPVIVTDATKQWDAVNKFNIDFLAKVICRAIKPFSFFILLFPCPLYSNRIGCPFVDFSESL